MLVRIDLERVLEDIKVAVEYDIAEQWSWDTREKYKGVTGQQRRDNEAVY